MFNVINNFCKLFIRNIFIRILKFLFYTNRYMSIRVSSFRVIGELIPEIITSFLYHFPEFTCVFFVYFFSVFERSTPVSGSSSIPAGVMFLGRGVNVLYGFSATCLLAILYIPNKAIIM